MKINFYNSNEWISILPETLYSHIRSLEKYLPDMDSRTKTIKALVEPQNAAMEKLLLKLLWGSLQSMGVFIDDKLNITDLKTMTDLAGFYEAWCEESIAILSANDYLRYDGGTYTVTGPVFDPELLWNEWDQAKKTWKQDDDQKANMVLAETCMRALPDILTGKQRATDIVFPNGSMKRVEGIYKENAVSDFFNEILENTVSAYFRDRLLHDPSAQIRILEIGAGVGGATEGLLLKLRPFQEHIDEYCYSDLSKAFLRHAEEHYLPLNPYLKLRIIDVEKPFSQQGIQTDHYDLVIAANVLHATKNIRQSLRNAKAALRRNGLIVLNEMSSNSLFLHLTFGLLEGWWLYEDDAVRIPGCPGLAPETWNEIMENEGLSPVLFPVKSAHTLGRSIIVAQSDGMIRQKAGYNTVESPGRNISPYSSRAINLSPSENNVEITGEYVKSLILETLSLSLDVSQADIDSDAPFSDYGVDSITGIGFIKQLNDRLGVAMNTSILFDYTSADRLANHITRVYGSHIRIECKKKDASPIDAPIQNQGTEPHQPPVLQEPHYPERKSCPKLQKQGMFKASEKMPESGEIAIIGFSGQFPGAENAETFWLNSVRGRDCIRELPSYYLNQKKFFSSKKLPGKTYCRWGGVLEGRDCFDPLFFNISRHEANLMNPHQRLILQESWKAFEDAGYNPRNFSGSRVGVFIGAEPIGYPGSFVGGSDAIVASRLSYYLNLTGPAFVVNTGCSSSGVAIHLACESLRNGESDLALAGGVSAAMGENMLIALSGVQMLSPSGRCRTFDESADGMVFSEGVGIVVLKKLEDALADNDPIHGVIQGTGMNQNGSSNGITAPSGLSQEELIAYVYKRFQIDPEEISYFEAHGTGTGLGDSVEANAFVRAFKRFTSKKHYCSVGSSKSHIGHTAACAGVIGLIHILLALRHRKIPKLLHFNKLNPLIEFEDSAFFVNTRLSEWKSKNRRPLMAALNTFGYSGNNVHLVVREHIPPRQNRENSLALNKPHPMLLPISAKTEESLRANAKKLWMFLDAQITNHASSKQEQKAHRPHLQHETINLPEIAYTL